MFRLFDFFKKNTKPSKGLEGYIHKNFGYHIKDLTLFETALTHKSFSNTKQDLESNERLEYLGDTVIDLIVADYLYANFPKKDEGYLTMVKAKIVNRKMLAYIGGELELRNHINYDSGRSIRLETLEGNALEAIIGAMYLEAGYNQCKKSFLSHILEKYIDFDEVLTQEIDFKSTLLIWAQKNKIALKFVITDDAKKENDFIYSAKATINGKDWGQGKGKSKKEAEQHASKETLQLLGIDASLR